MVCGAGKACVESTVLVLWAYVDAALYPDGHGGILLLWIMIALTTQAFWKVKRSAGLLMLPYLAWVTFAAVLNFTLWRMNG